MHYEGIILEMSRMQLNLFLEYVNMLIICGIEVPHPTSTQFKERWETLVIG